VIEDRLTVQDYPAKLSYEKLVSALKPPWPSDPTYFLRGYNDKEPEAQGHKNPEQIKKIYRTSLNAIRQKGRQ